MNLVIVGRSEIQPSLFSNLILLFHAVMLS